MKNLLLFILLLPTVAFSQEINLSLYGGICPYKMSDNGFAPAPKSSFISTFKASVKLRKTELGIGVAEQSLTGSLSGTGIGAIAKPLITPHFFVNRLALMPNGYFYGGVMAGVAIANVGEEKEVHDFYNPTSYNKTTYQIVPGYTAGVQVGFVYNVTKHLGAGIEAAFRYIQVPNNYSLLSFPLTLGVRWRL